MIIPQGFAQVTAGFTGPGVPTGAACTFGILWGPPSDPQASLTSIHTLLQDFHFATATESVLLSSVEIKAGPNATGASIGASGATNGGQGNVNEQPNTAWLLKKRTSLGGRQGQGRCFWPGVPEGWAQNDGTITPSEVVDVQAAADTLLDGLLALAHPMYLLHSTATAPTEVIAFVVDARTSSQRNRLRR